MVFSCEEGTKCLLGLESNRKSHCEMNIEAKNLVKRYPDVEALNIERLNISNGESVGLVGNNGAGKTTFLRILLDLIRPTEGSIEIDGQVVAKSPDWKRRSGSYLDDSFLIEYLSPEEFFRFVGKTHNISKEEIFNRLSPFSTFFAGEILGRKRYIRDLSQGNKKKVGIAAALMVEPELIVLDEPFANLDPTSQIRLKNILRDISRREDRTILISSHELNHITEVCGRVAILEQGRIVHDIQTSSDTLQDLNEYFTVDDSESKLL